MAAPSESQRADEHIAEAILLWEAIAAFAWGQFVTNGRGVVLLEQQALTAAASRVKAGGSVADAEFAPGYVCARDVPPSDDFAPIIADYDPHRQIVLLLRLDNSDERLYVLETSTRHQRPTPRECFESLHQPDPPQ